MSLSELDEKLHKHDEAEPLATHEPSEFNPGRAPAGAEIRLTETSDWHDARTRFFARYKKEIRRGAVAIGAIAFFALLVGTFVRIQQSLFSENRVTVTVSGPSNVGGSDLTTFIISYRNANRSGLSNAELVVSYPSGFRPEANEATFQDNASSSVVAIGDVPAFGEGSFEFSGKFFGSKNTLAYIGAELRYQPKNLESRFSAKGHKSVNLRTASLAVELEAPLTISPQGEATYLVNYENTSDATLSNVRLKASYPSGFSLIEGDPRPSEGDVVWYLGTLSAGEKGKVRITGILDGIPNETKLFRVELGTFQGDNTFLSYSDVERTTRVVAPPFGIRQVVNGAAPAAVDPGDALRYEIQYRNDSPTALREVILTVELEGDALDFSRLRPEKGAYDSARKRIVWKASDVGQFANLAPNASGKVEFSVPVRGDDFVPESAIAKNFRVKTTAKIESPDVPNPAGANKIVATNTMWVKVNSRLLLETLGSYQNGDIPNTGPIPPTVGEETTYTLRWQLANTTNDVTGAEVSADLPTGARWTGKTFPASETLVYNERTNKIVWSVGSMGVGEGFLSPKRSVSFQVSVRPEVNQVDMEVPLLGVSTAKATDVFTQSLIRSETREKTTNLREDTSIPSSGYKVKGK
jgi:hypothetical protein